MKAKLTLLAAAVAAVVAHPLAAVIPPVWGKR